MKNYIQLKSLNTFRISVFAAQVIKIYDVYALIKHWKNTYYKAQPVLILGRGSNVLFLDNFIGTILINKIKGIFVTEYNKIWRLRVGAGEKWDKLVTYAINHNIPGLENLACIPGSVGAAPIHNIGAYGIELSKICEYVDIIDLYNEKVIRFTHEECLFQYRSSIFKNILKNYAIIFVGLKLSKKWKPILNYGELNCLKKHYITPKQIFKFIRKIRYNKIPNVKKTGNAGSFFKNPIINAKKAYNLLSLYPNMPYYRQIDGAMKLSAGWLIDNCSLKGYILGRAAIYSKQSLILINNKNMANGTEIAALALYIYTSVAKKFNIYLQPEVIFIGKHGKINPKKIFL
ncbi:UDP-N-acetylmuramate dehydrogenase [Candidatus Blochmannia ocreatus (nom. nud.)]|uniref:UDP-N-acetylenolpyruvoylglucosamine reductase n=1 Tax=Candidatus Blochmannia ocreatus (nom. nud.) TaxID=251538 RepID=A0ABY4SYB1_9ENTR|nr:UDP-N-acetylmuramate dehydrogenase [Candidatus Blochmannia ocreatus]URJ25263.1 UDP-N-acetylmuramate dehydrogenase [Candidatus Blochmannia ocreatus]